MKLIIWHNAYGQHLHSVFIFIASMGICRRGNGSYVVDSGLQGEETDADDSERVNPIYRLWRWVGF